MPAQIVVIDDEPDVLRVLCDLLEDEGFSVACFGRPQDIQSLYGGAHPCLFLIDIMLPGASGIEVAQQLRAGYFAETPMIAMSASPSMISAAQSTGLFQDAFSKPFDLDTVLATVEQFAG